MWKRKRKLIWLLDRMKESLLIQSRFKCTHFFPWPVSACSKHQAHIVIINGDWQSKLFRFHFYFCSFILFPSPAVYHTILLFHPFLLPPHILFLCICSGWRVICFSFQIRRMGAISQTWAVNPGRNAQRSPRSRFENWNRSSLTTTIWHGSDATKSLSTLTLQRDKYVDTQSVFTCFWET